MLCRNLGDKHSVQLCGPVGVEVNHVRIVLDCVLLLLGGVAVIEGLPWPDQAMAG